jgi:hypothetical protein
MCTLCVHYVYIMCTLCVHYVICVHFYDGKTYCSGHVVHQRAVLKEFILPLCSGTRKARPKLARFCQM